jgi:PUB domain
MAYSSAPTSPSSPPQEGAMKGSYKQATGRFKLLCTFDAVFTDNKETNLITAKLLKTLVSNARSQRDPKYQTIHLYHPKIHRYIAMNQAAVDLLQVIGFVKSSNSNPDTDVLSEGMETSEYLTYSPSGMPHLQEGSRLEKMLDDKIAMLQKVDRQSSTVKQHKAGVKTKKMEAEDTRKQQVAMFQEDRMQQRERQERQKRSQEQLPTNGLDIH